MPPVAYHATAVALVPPPERREPRMSQSELPLALSMGMASPLPVALPLPAPEVGLAALPHATPLSDDPLGDPTNSLPPLPSTEDLLSAAPAWLLSAIIHMLLMIA